MSLTKHSLAISLNIEILNIVLTMKEIAGYKFWTIIYKKCAGISSVIANRKWKQILLKMCKMKTGITNS